MKFGVLHSCQDAMEPSVALYARLGTEAIQIVRTLLMQGHSPTLKDAKYPKGDMLVNFQLIFA
jgi:hypothetical protein